MTSSSQTACVGLSISDSPIEDLTKLGLSDLHVSHVFIELVRHILARGGSIAYGGDLRVTGYTESLFDLIRTYDRKDLRGPDRVYSYLAWPIWKSLSISDRADLINVATIVEVAPPRNSPEDLPVPADRSPAERLWNAFALTKMREEMNGEIQARVVLGGRVSGQQGLVPGVLEEIDLALKSRMPLYLVGGYGGCTRRVVASILGSPVEEFTVEHQAASNPNYMDILNEARSLGISDPFEAIIRRLSTAGIGGLHNGLSDTENYRLFETDDTDEVVALVLNGMSRVFRDSLTEQPET